MAQGRNSTVPEVGHAAFLQKLDQTDLCKLFAASSEDQIQLNYFGLQPCNPPVVISGDLTSYAGSGLLSSWLEDFQEKAECCGKEHQ